MTDDKLTTNIIFAEDFKNERKPDASDFPKCTPQRYTPIPN